jgi:hypothetical protein
MPNGLPAETLGRLEQGRTMRRQLNDGPMQRFVADQIAILEYLAYIASAEQPAARTDVTNVLVASEQGRQAADHVLEQAIDVERTVAAIWAIRMGMNADLLASSEVAP